MPQFPWPGLRGWCMADVWLVKASPSWRWLPPLRGAASMPRVAAAVSLWRRGERANEGREGAPPICGAALRCDHVMTLFYLISTCWDRGRALRRLMVIAGRARAAHGPEPPARL
jgi:hypothetical protein